MDKIGILSSALNASSLRQQAISNNISNAETPNYQAKQVVFEDVLKAKINEQSSFTGKRTDHRHFEIGQKQGIPTPVMQNSSHGVMHNNGNSVDIDREMAQMGNNALWYYSLTQQLNSEFQKLSIAIKGRV